MIVLFAILLQVLSTNLFSLFLTEERCERDVRCKFLKPQAKKTPSYLCPLPTTNRLLRRDLKKWSFSINLFCPEIYHFVGEALTDFCFCFIFSLNPPGKFHHFSLYFCLTSGLSETFIVPGCASL